CQRLLRLRRGSYALCRPAGFYRGAGGTGCGRASDAALAGRAQYLRVAGTGESEYLDHPGQAGTRPAGAGSAAAWPHLSGVTTAGIISHATGLCVADPGAAVAA